MQEFSLEIPTLSFGSKLSSLVCCVRDISSSYNNTRLTRGKHDNTQCVFDTGATNDLTPFWSDFLDYQEVCFDVKALNDVIEKRQDQPFQELEHTINILMLKDTSKQLVTGRDQ